MFWTHISLVIAISKICPTTTHTKLRGKQNDTAGSKKSEKNSGSISCKALICTNHPIKHADENVRAIDPSGMATQKNSQYVATTAKKGEVSRRHNFLLERQPLYFSGWSERIFICWAVRGQSCRQNQQTDLSGFVRRGK